MWGGSVGNCFGLIDKPRWNSETWALISKVMLGHRMRGRRNSSIAYRWCGKLEILVGHYNKQKSKRGCHGEN